MATISDGTPVEELRKHSIRGNNTLVIRQVKSLASCQHTAYKLWYIFNLRYM